MKEETEALFDLVMKNLKGPVRWPGTEYDLPQVPDGFWPPVWYCVPRWFGIDDYRNAPENKNPKRPVHYGFLSWDSNTNMHAWMYGKRPPVLGGWHLYICRRCDRLFTSRQSPHMIKTDNCGCEQKRATVQTVRLEGQQFGWLVAVEYRAGDGSGKLGGWECMCLGIDGNCQRTCIVPTQRLLKLRTLGCEICIPEDWGNKRGAKPFDSPHGCALNHHHKRSKSEKQPT